MYISKKLAEEDSKCSQYQEMNEAMDMPVTQIWSLHAIACIEVMYFITVYKYVSVKNQI